MPGSASQPIAIIGGGFSGLMVAANLVRASTRPHTIYIIAEEADGLGIAYRTRNAAHLLNVPAGNMGAFADAADGFYQWLQTAEAAPHRDGFGIAPHIAATDFMPRALYAAYLQSIWHATQKIAAQKSITLAHVPSRATAIRAEGGIAVLTERGDAIAAAHIVLATGHELKPVIAHIPARHVIQNPWAADVFAAAKHWASPVVLMGTGLTAVDTLLSLRHAGYAGEIIAFSRHGLLPQPHAPYAGGVTLDVASLLAHPSLAALLRDVHDHAQSYPWRAVVDGLRPHTQTLWQKFSTRDQQRFLSRVLPFWNVHRHRMAPHIAATIAAEMESGNLRILASKLYEARVENDQLHLTLHLKNASQNFAPAVIINCTGPELNLAKSRSTLLRQALADGVVEPHATGLGIAVDPQHRAWGALYPNLYAIGPLMTGQLLESTAVPELRVQAAGVAKNMLQA